MVKRLCMAALTALALATLAFGATRHPAESFVPHDLQRGWGTDKIGYQADLNLKDLTFHAPYPAAGEMNNLERYMVAGAYDPSTRKNHDAWYRDVLHVVCAYESKTGVIPDVLTPEVISEALDGSSTFHGGAYDLLRNPLTGEWPKLKQSSFSPGDVYCRPLTDGEIRVFCNTDADLHDLYLNQRFVAAGSGEYVPSKIIGKVFYMRVYGQNKVIHAGIHYRWSGVPMGN